MEVKSRINLLSIFFLLVLIACSKEDETSDETVQEVERAQYDTTAYPLFSGRLGSPSIPEDNRLTYEKVKLGRLLFYEKRLSRNNQISCASCHRQEFAFTDTNRFSLGVRGKAGLRNSMAVINMAWNSNGFFWDGRAELLRHQALEPIKDTLEMDEQIHRVIEKLMGDELYMNQFIRAFGDPQINPQRISLALEQFMNSIVSNKSKYDRYLSGTTTLDSNEERGRQLFFNEFSPAFPALSGADCQHCHTGYNFENDQFMNNGLDTDQEMSDEGFMKVSGESSDRGKFKIPTLRNIELTAPYMHDGRFKTLEEVIDHYNSGLKSSSTLDPTLQYPLSQGGLKLSEEDKRDLIAFLKTLTDRSLIENEEYSNPF